MKVDVSQQLTNRSGQAVKAGQSGAATGMTSSKSFNELSPGDRFAARVTDIKVNQVTIKLHNGETLTAKSQVLPEARIGEEAIFMVKENFKGQILLEMVKPDSNTLENNILREALANAGLYASSENIDIARTLVHSNMPIDADTLRSAAFFYNIGENFDINKMLFLLKENFLPLEKNMELLNGIIDKNIRIGDSLQMLTGLLLNSADNELREQLLGILLDTPSGESSDATLKETAFALLGRLSALSDGEEKQAVREQLKALINGRAFIELSNDDALKSLSTYYKSIYEKTIKMKEAASASGKASEILNQLDEIIDNVEFMNHISNYKEYLQIPFSLMGQENQGELLIFKDGKNSRNISHNASVLISMDYVSLGHVETFITKSDNTLSIQFRSDFDRTLSIMRNNFAALSSALNSKGYTITASSFKRINEPFNITQNSEASEKADTKSVKRYSFDMRV